MTKEALKFIHDALIVGAVGEQSDGLPKEVQIEVWKFIEDLEAKIKEAE